MHERWALAPAAARFRGDEGNRRLHQRWVTFIDRKKRHQVATTAIARELAGWCWSLAVLDDMSLADHQLLCPNPARWQREERPANAL